MEVGIEPQNEGTAKSVGKIIWDLGKQPVFCSSTNTNTYHSAAAVEFDTIRDLINDVTRPGHELDDLFGRGARRKLI